MYLSILLLPLLSFGLCGLLGRKVGVTGSHIISCTLSFLSLILGLIAFYEVCLSQSPVIVKLFSWLDCEYINIYFSFSFDSLTVSMFLAVLVVSFLVQLYSTEYMQDDPHNQRFFSYLSLFTLLMLVLITADNYLVMFLGWEGVGISSFLLVGFWFTRQVANTSALSAILYNRVGDMFLTIGLFTMVFIIGNIDYATLFSLAPYISENLVFILGLLLLLGAMAKSAQLGLHVWLPQAMEGPTPVSALIHAATMVTAGIYLLIRSSPLIEYSSLLLTIILWLGAFTALFAGLCGLFMNDIKKIIAYSTMSQLGYMVVAIGLSSYTLALFHLVNHAFFKACLFMAAGQVIHAVSDNQSLYKYGGLSKALPLANTVIFISSLALLAAPFTAGYYSKEIIISMSRVFSNNSIYWIITITAVLTSLYSYKLIYYTFITPPNGPSQYYNITNLTNSKISYDSNKVEPSHESTFRMNLPLIVLGIAGIFSGYLFSDVFIGLGNNLFTDSIFTHPNNSTLIECEFDVPHIYKLLPLILSIFAVLIYTILLETSRNPFNPFFVVSYIVNNLQYNKRKTISNTWKKPASFSYFLGQNSSRYMNIYRFFNHKFWFELFVNKYVTTSTLNVAYHVSKTLDRGYIELWGPYGLGLLLSNISNRISKLDSGIVTHYSLYMFLGLTFSSLYIFYMS